MTQTSTAVFVPARLPSERLPRKLLRPIGGRPGLLFLIDRVASRVPRSEIVVCTTPDRADDPLVRLAEDAGVRHFRGARHDIIARLHDAAQAFGVDAVVNVDGDDFFCAPELIAQARDQILLPDTDFVRWTDLPLGAAPVAFTTRALAMVRRLKSADDTETGWGRFFLDSSRFVIREPPGIPPELRRPDVRMTLDYEEDYQFFVRVAEELQDLGVGFPLAEIVSLVTRKPELLAINAHVNEQYWKRFNAAAVDPHLGP